MGGWQAQTARARRHAPSPSGCLAATLSKADVVVVEATGNAAAVAAVITPHVKRVVIANPKQVRVIAHAKIKTDKPAADLAPEPPPRLPRPACRVHGRAPAW